MRSIPIEPQQKVGIGNLKYSSPQPPSSPIFQTPSYDGNNTNEQEATTLPSSLSRISPLILLVIIVLAVIFFVYGLVHLVLWFLMKRPSSSSLYNSSRFPESTRSRALQRQLQQLFRMHDSGLDQALIDALPVFYYQDLLGLKEPFDCAVCLCEFSEEDKLRLVPMCSHAFHMNCLDTWLLSNSTCPLCRATLSSSTLENPVFHVENSCVMPHGFGATGEEENNGCSHDQGPVTEEELVGGKRVFSVRLGKFRNSGLKGGEAREVVDGGGSSSLDGRRCYSMGSYQYVVRDSNLQVVLSQSNDDIGGEEGELRRGYLCDVSENGDVDGKKIGNNRTKGESFSVSNAAFP